MSTARGQAPERGGATIPMTPDPDAHQLLRDIERLEIPHGAPFLLRFGVSDDGLSRAIPHVSNVEYVRWLDRAAELHSDSLGFTRESLLAEERMWFVARHEIDYRGEAWPGDELVIATWVRQMERTRSWREYRIVRPSDRRIICSAATLWVYVDLSTRRPCRVPDRAVAAFQPLAVS